MTIFKVFLFYSGLILASASSAQTSATPTATPVPVASPASAPAVSPSASPTPEAAATPRKPVSISYENLIRCFPELQDEGLSFKVDLNLLKDVIDKKFVTLQSVLRQRKINYLDSERQSTNLILRTQTPMGQKKQTELILQQVDSKGIITDIKLTKNQSVNPKQETINNFLLNSTIKSDEYLYNDTKLNGVTMIHSRNFKEVQDIQLIDKVLNRTISCEKKSDLGIICTCSKK